MTCAPSGSRALHGSWPESSADLGRWLSGATVPKRASPTVVRSYYPNPRQSKLRKEHLVATKVVMVDDLDGHDGEDVAKRDFEVSGVTYTIDLGDENFKRLEELLGELAPYIEKATKVRQAGRARKSAADTAPR